MTPISNENNLLLHCCRADVSGKDASDLNNLLAGPLDWEFIWGAAQSYNISPLLYYNLRGLSNSSSIPATIMENLRGAYHETVAKNMLLYSELHTVIDAFRQAGLEAIVLKGAALAGIVYPNIGLRPMADIDLLVKKEELAAVERVMADLEYQPTQGIKSQQRFRDNHFHLPPYTHVRKPMTVEIHWHFTDNTDSDIRQWWERALLKDLRGCRILVPSAEDMLNHLSLHLFNHGYHKGFVLRCLCDIFQTVRQYGDEIDWELLQDKIKQEGTEKQVHTLFQLVRKVYAPGDDSFIPLNLDHADQRFLRVLETNLFRDNEDTPINPRLLKSMMFDSFAKKMKYFLPRVFPSWQQMAERYDTSPYSLMTLFYYLVRPFSLLSRYGRSAVGIYRTKSGGKL